MAPYSAVLIPERVIAGNPQYLLTRRRFYNKPEGRPFRYPGEWLAAGGMNEPADRSPEETALREFREETRYASGISSVRLFRVGHEFSPGREYPILFFTARLDAEPSPERLPTGEVREVKWDTAEGWLETKLSAEFTRQQLEEIARRNLGDPRYGEYATITRVVPSQVIFTLGLLRERGFK
ncbi:MAG: NUDIX domain-containing protein [Nanoarchaeota archaeon]